MVLQWDFCLHNFVILLFLLQLNFFLEKNHFLNKISAIGPVRRSGCLALGPYLYVFDDGIVTVMSFNKHILLYVCTKECRFTYTTDIKIKLI